jgi:hypothetical protein
MEGFKIGLVGDNTFLCPNESPKSLSSCLWTWVGDEARDPGLGADKKALS